MISMEVSCPYCNSKFIKKEGKRKLKLLMVQKYRCLGCKKYFAKKNIKYKSYPERIVLNAMSTYNLGYTLEQTKKEMAKRFHIKIPESTIHSWVKDYSEVCRFTRLRKQLIGLHIPEQMIFSQNLQHKQIYKYQLHRVKLELTKNELQPQKFQLLKAYLKRISTDSFPHHIFNPKQEDLPELARSSQMKFKTQPLIRQEKENLSNKLAEFGLMLAKTNRDRHQTIQDFMLINDSVTVACEIPVYLTKDDIDYFKQRNFIFNFENFQTPITGHIDILQIRNGLIHILDYKPEASKVDAVNQLIVYALALASRTKLAVKDFKCAWFDEKKYYEFFPLHAVRIK
jgi:transposase-like protein